VWFAYTPDRKGEHPRQHLKNFKGALQADAYAGFHHLYGGGDIYEVACRAHSRRKFHDIHAIHASPITTEPSLASPLCTASKKMFVASLPSCDARFAKPAPGRCSTICEAGWKNLSAHCPPRARLRVRSAMRSRTGVRSTATSTMDCLEIDNSAAERALRAVALGRKNYLFCGSNSGGERAAAIYSMVGSAKLNGLDTERYLRQVLTRIAEHPVNRIDELLPWNLAAEHNTHSSAPS
jgi:hypothetical protein